MANLIFCYPSQDDLKYIQEKTNCVFSAQEIQDIHTRASKIRIIYGCIKSIKFESEMDATSNKEHLILSQVVIYSSHGEAILSCRSNPDFNSFHIKNLNVFSSIIKNSLDFGHKPVISINIDSMSILSIDLLPFECNIRPRVARSGTGGGSTSRP